MICLARKAAQIIYAKKCLHVSFSEGYIEEVIALVFTSAYGT